MVLHEFPDLGWLKKQISEGFASGEGWRGRVLQDPGWPTVILNTRSTSVFRNDIVGPISLFTNIQGNSRVSAGGTGANVDSNCFFLSNAGQPYTLHIDRTAQRVPTETFNVHFGERFGEQAFAAITSRDESLVDDPQQLNQTPAFHNKLYPRDTTLNRILLSIQSVSDKDIILEEQKLYQLMSHLLLQNSQIARRSRQLPALKSSTREEILRRLFLSTDYIYSFFDRDLSLDELANVSCLSKFHYLRMFEALFRVTPHQFITGVRIARAKDLLLKTDLEVHEIGQRVGFSTPSSFSRLFYSRIGSYPSQFRAGKQIFGN